MRVVWSDEAWKLLDNILQECENRFGKKNVEKLVTCSFASHRAEKVALPVHRQIMVEIKL